MGWRGVSPTKKEGKSRDATTCCNVFIKLSVEFLVCAAPKGWLKYTTVANIMFNWEIWKVFLAFAPHSKLRPGRPPLSPHPSYGPVSLVGFQQQFLVSTKRFVLCFRGKIHYMDMFALLKQIDPPLGFGSKCPDLLAYKRLVRMNMPVDVEGKVHFTSTLFALVRVNLNIFIRW